MIDTMTVPPDSGQATSDPGPAIDAWDAWTPAEAAARLEPTGVPWWVVGGWAIDLFLGAETREHSDLEIEILRPDFDAVRGALVDLDPYVVMDGTVHRLAADDAYPGHPWHQSWMFDGDAERWRVDVMLQPGDADTWIFRRDESIEAPRTSMVDRTADGVPYLAPHGTLFYKAKAMREKDIADFDACLPRLDGHARSWLADSLTRAHPDHPWIGRLR